MKLTITLSIILVFILWLIEPIVLLFGYIITWIWIAYELITAKTIEGETSDF